MTTVAAFPRAIQQLDPVWIPLGDGTRLAARIWLPEDAEENPVPAILEYLPYRKRDGTVAARRADASLLRRPRLCLRPRRHARHRRFRRRARSTNTAKQEQDDALEVIAWIAAQPWCTGKVGMIGISWGGFNALQVAARRPAGAEGHHHALLDRRPLRRRHPLHGRLPARRESRLGVDHVRLHARARPIPRWSASAGARCGSSG